ncbi:MAG TPA: serine/threonine-protein kinase, partial [Candidatus Saccharimonadia bacterium]|nr:serine/threonine-protein kinase [Candidatus Saccharimonadia bacterium]
MKNARSPLDLLEPGVLLAGPFFESLLREAGRGEHLPPPAVPTHPHPQPGESLGHYRIEEICGEGGMGSVYRAWDCALERPAAVKLLHAGAAGALNPAMRREAHALSRLQHPNIATFFEVGEIQGQPYLALEFVDGVSLAKRLRAGPLDFIELQRLATGLLWALAHAHAAGVLHCDIKPANIVLRENGDPVLLDFGIAKLLKADAQPQEAALTGGGWVIGSPGYMAPEQLLGAPLSERSDLYAVALVLIEALSGEPGCSGRDSRERAEATLRGEPRQRAEHLDTPLRTLLMRALSDDPAQRPESAAAMQFELQQLWQHRDEDRGPRRMLALEPECADLDAGLRWVGTALIQSVRCALAGKSNLELASPAIATARVGSGTADGLRLGQQLGCRWVLGGGISGNAAALRIRLQLTDARNEQ